MGRWKTVYEFTNKRKVFKTYYIVCAIFNVFGLASLWSTRYHKSELNTTKWVGGFIGTAQSVGILALVYSLCNLWDMQALGIALFVLHIVYIILFGFLYKTE